MQMQSPVNFFEIGKVTILIVFEGLKKDYRDEILTSQIVEREY